MNEIFKCRKFPAIILIHALKSTVTFNNVFLWSAISFLVPHSNDSKEYIFKQASLPKPVWDLAVQVMDLFEKGKLKNQKLNLIALLYKPEFKQQYLAPIHSLPVDDQVAILNKVIVKEISLSERKTVANDVKCMHDLKLTFIKLTNCTSWENTVEAFPKFVQADCQDSVFNITSKSSYLFRLG